MKKKTKGIMKKVLIAFVIGVVIGAVATVLVRNGVFTKTEEAAANPSTIFERVVAEDELTVASMKYQYTDKATNSKKYLKFLTTNSFWYRLVGNLKMSVDLSKMEKVSESENGITVSLPNPKITSNTIDWDESGTLEENNNILNMIKSSDVDEFKKKATQKVIDEAESDAEFVKQAKKNAQDSIERIFRTALGEEFEVTIQWGK